MAKKKSKTSVKTKSSSVLKVNYDPSYNENTIGNSCYSEVMWVTPRGQVFYKDLDNLSLADYYYMKDDYQIAACLNAIALALETIDWRVTSKNKKAEKFITVNLKEIWSDVLPTVALGI